MTTKQTYNEEDWQKVMGAPVLAGTFLMVSDLGITSLVGETKAMTDAIVSGNAPDGVKDLVGSIAADMMAMAKNKEKMEPPAMPEEAKTNPQAAKNAILSQIKEGVDLVAQHGSAEEAADFKHWLVSVATAVAEAGKEGGFLGIGAVRVSDKEKAALEELSAALGL
jgi:hypothetical protein